MTQVPGQPGYDAPETIEVTEHRVACDGGGGALGHPRVFLEMGDEHNVQCPYCGRFYVLSGSGHDAGKDLAAPGARDVA
ncbi:MAG: zinc-finger domain-containing protein [Alphaproteobacteria bacterium]|nr:zinc-finger domain-containing protein [Alphaproteobacteria bacterium]